jgi:hypothetical protein
MPKRSKLDKKLPPQKVVKPAFVLPGPNSDIEAYGWDMSKLRYPDPKSAEKKDPDPGPPIFLAPEADWEHKQRYGHDINFLCPQYIQLMLDKSKSVRDAALAAHDERYTKDAVAAIERAVLAEFTKTILPEIQKNFGQIAGIVAQFYAARIAHIKKFGHA